MMRDPGRRLHEDQALIHLGQRLAELCRAATTMGWAPLASADDTETLLLIREEIRDLIGAISRLTPASEAGREAKRLADRIGGGLSDTAPH
jgi:hypothetical protein